MEANGKISFLPKIESQNPTNKDLKLNINRKGLCINLIIDGQIIREALKDANKEEKWLLKKITEKKYKLEEVILATIDLQNNLKVYGKNVKDTSYDILN